MSKIREFLDDVITEDVGINTTVKGINVLFKGSIDKVYAKSISDTIAHIIDKEMNKARLDVKQVVLVLKNK